jgi:hypothetical protein
MLVCESRQALAVLAPGGGGLVIGWVWNIDTRIDYTARSQILNAARRYRADPNFLCVEPFQRDDLRLNRLVMRRTARPETASAPSVGVAQDIGRRSDARPGGVAHKAVA